MLKPKKYLKKDIVIMLIIILLPFLFYLYNLAPRDTKIWKIWWFEIDSGMYEEVDYYVWLLAVKFLTLLILSIWFLTCKYWWRVILFIPLSVEVHKINNTFTGVEFGNTYSPIYLKSLIYSLFFICMLMFLSRKLKFYRRYNTLNVNRDINEELIKLSKFDAKKYKLVKTNLLALEKRKDKLEKKKYLTELILLRDQLSI
ncbi:hypothetical protein [uncultured Psychroserpens sp.]|uniref:hypothetical protein n=1 Tax=uncultured Psychroserpens sp. TaxID=255436 RepID=UPI002633B53D|nr:hypothetical protein [uncultured Psychroserpens sp.]